MNILEGSAWSPLRHKLFRSLWIAGLVANSALWMQNVGAAWWMTTIAASPMMVALVQTATTLPAFLFNLPGGVLADQIDRRRWLLSTQSTMFSSAAVMGILLVMGSLNAWSLLILTFILGTGNALNASAWSSTAGDVVPTEEVPSALALNSVSFNLARALGPVLSGIIIGWSGTEAVFLINAACFCVVICILLQWRSPKKTRNPLPPERLFDGMRTGLRYVRHSPPARIVLVRTVTFVTSASSLWALLPLVARDQAGVGPSGYGVLLASFGAGAILCAFLLPKFRQRFALNALVASSSLIFATTILAIAYAANPWLLCTIFFVSGLTWMSGNSTVSAVLQTNVPSWVRSRIVSVYLLAFQGSMAIGCFFWGAVANYTDIRSALTISAGLTLIGVWHTRSYVLKLGTSAEATQWTTDSAPPLRVDISNDDGPVAVQIEHRVTQELREEFIRTVHAMGAVRKRNGARAWRLYRDLSDQTLYAERFVVDSWLDYLRQWSRWTVADRQLEQHLMSFESGNCPSRIQLFVAEQTK